MRDLVRSLQDRETTKIIDEDAIQWVLHTCLNRYLEMHLQSQTLSIPMKTSHWSDTPSGGGGFYSAQEIAVLKKDIACEWMKMFHEKLEYLPDIHQQIIKRKYLIRDALGKFQNDYLVYDELNISRSSYYRMKKEALYFFALLLRNEPIMQRQIESSQ